MKHPFPLLTSHFSLQQLCATVLAALILSAVGSAFAQAPVPSAEDVPEPVLIGVLAKRGVDRCLEKWGLTAEYLTKEIPGFSFTIVTLGFEEIDPAVERHEVDFILANPSSYIELEMKYGINRLVTLKNRSTTGPVTVFGGVIFFRADREDIQDLGDLKDKSFMGVNEFSLGGWLAARQEMKEVGIDPYRDLRNLTFAGTQDVVVYAVRDGKADVGSVRTDTLERMAAEGLIRLEDFRVLRHDRIGEEDCQFPFMHTTDMYPEWPMAKLDHTSDELAEKIAVALLTMQEESPAAKAARCVGWTVPPNYQPVHDCLKELKVGPYEDYGKATWRQVLGQYWIALLTALAFLLVSAAFGLHATRSKKRLLISRDARRESEERFKTIYENAPVLINAFDENGGCVLWNKECQETFGWTLDEIKAQPDALTLLYPDPVQRDEVMRTISSESDGTFREWRPLTKDGRTLITMWANFRLPDGMAFGLGHDITDRKRAEAELE
ncbi:MAG: PhnD/SsuA/transferrin family substrate-binding protein, partial [Thermoanaerobaculales bacterium]|nr:PhnD/SsuA/transferrin family substrate-binding protein [Thermoanaerobaculales bacterium]